MITAWAQEYSIRTPNMVPAKLVGAENIRKALVPTAPASFVGISLLSPRNSECDDRAASPGWGGTAPSKSLIGRHWLETETTANTLATRSRIGHKQRTITAASLGAWQRLSPDSETRTGRALVCEGLSLPFK